MILSLFKSINTVIASREAAWQSRSHKCRLYRVTLLPSRSQPSGEGWWIASPPKFLAARNDVEGDVIQLKCIPL